MHWRAAWRTALGARAPVACSPAPGVPGWCVWWALRLFSCFLPFQGGCCSVFPFLFAGVSSVLTVPRVARCSLERLSCRLHPAFSRRCRPGVGSARAHGTGLSSGSSRSCRAPAPLPHGHRRGGQIHLRYRRYWFGLLGFRQQPCKPLFLLASVFFSRVEPRGITTSSCHASSLAVAEWPVRWATAAPRMLQAPLTVGAAVPADDTDSGPTRAERASGTQR